MAPHRVASLLGSLALGAALLPSVAAAGSISAPGFLAGPDSTAATPNPAAPHYNPAALGGTNGVRTMMDVQTAFIRVNATTTRNGGIDPNTGQKYLPSEASVMVPVALLGVSWKPIDQLAFGFSVSDTFVGGGDYTAAEPDQDKPYVGHQRYAGVQTAIIQLHMVPAVAVTPIEGLHFGGGLKIIYNSISALQAADPLHTEGVHPDDIGGDPAARTRPYEGDTYLEGSATGMTLGWNAGVYFDKFEKARVGISYTRNGTFSAEGEGKVTVPDYLSQTGAQTEVDALMTFDQPMPDILQFWVNSDLTDRLTLGAGMEYQMWNACCGGPADTLNPQGTEGGDLRIGVTDANGNPIGPETTDLTISVAEEQWSPRRLWNSGNYAINGGYKVSDLIWVGARAQYSQNAVPDYAVSATNLDYESIGGQGAIRFRFGKDRKFTAGVSYAKFFTFDRTITNSVWDIGNGDPRFSPETPYKANTNGTFSSKVDIAGVRLAARF